jgi:nucleolar GTP-binding protein
MVVYNFKKIQAVPGATDFVDIVLTRTQRGTPTVVHKGYAISRIRAFYMRKVKFTQSTFSEKLTQIIEDFPRMDDIHPFYADLLNVLYDRDHYKLALGQVNTARALIDGISKDYIKLLKYADSLFRCKTLKRAALGRMCTLMKKQKQSLSYLEEVRGHLARLPSIDPNTRTLLVTGYPNVGKSSFMNKVTRADVDVQPYAFTTKSLYVGHCDYRYLRWQIIDTPGILDHSLEERNTIEMQAVTALAHLQCSVLFFIDISEQCGFTIEQQMSLFNNIRPLFVDKPLVLVVNKIDVQKFCDLSEEHQALINQGVRDTKATMLQMSNLAELGVMEVRNTAADLLLERRVDTKMQQKKVQGVLNRLTVSMPKPLPGEAPRELCIPDSVKQRRAEGLALKTSRKTQKQLQAEHGGAGNYAADYTDEYDLKYDEWKTDIQPEIMDGKNIFDFIDPDIMAKLEALEREEEAREEEEAMQSEDSDVDEDERSMVKAIRGKKQIARDRHALNAGKNRIRLPRGATHSNGEHRTVEAFKEHLESINVDSSLVKERGRKRQRSLSRGLEQAEGMEEARTPLEKKKVRKESISRHRSHSRPKTPQDEGLRDQGLKDMAVAAQYQGQKKRSKHARAGEADRHYHDPMPKHLFSGKRGIGKTDRR